MSEFTDECWDKVTTWAEADEMGGTAATDARRSLTDLFTELENKRKNNYGEVVYENQQLRHRVELLSAELEELRRKVPNDSESQG